MLLKQKSGGLLFLHFFFHLLVSEISFFLSSFYYTLTLKEPFSLNNHDTVAKILNRRWQRPEACNFIKKETLAQVFSCELCEIFKSTFFYRKPQVAASEYLFHRQIIHTNIQFTISIQSRHKSYWKIVKIYKKF